MPTVQTYSGAVYPTSGQAYSGVVYVNGEWNASTNIPFLASSVGIENYAYRVSVAGSTSLNGVSDWNVDDFVIFSGGAWRKLTGKEVDVSALSGVGSGVLTALANPVNSANGVVTQDASGNLLVGTTGGVTGKGFIVNNPNDGSYTDICHTSAAGSGYAYEQFRYSGAVIGSIAQNGTTGVLYNTISDVSLKQDILPANSSIASILAFPVDQYNWKSDGTHTDYGCIAQKAAEYAPEIVTKGEKWSVDYGRITPRLIKAFQELAVKVAELEEKLNAK